MNSWRQLRTIAEKEIKIHLRSAWTYTFLILLFVFMLPIVLLHVQNAFNIGQYSKLTATVMNLLLYYLPLMTLIISSFSMTQEKEDASLSYLLTYPIRPHTWVAGKFLGIVIVLFFLIVLCFSLLGLVSFLSNAPLSLANYTFLLSFSLCLTLFFSAAGIFFGAIAKNRWQSLILSVAFWILLVLAWPMLFIVFLSSLHYRIVTNVLQIATLFNPSELVRIFFTIKFGGGTILGPEYLHWITWADSMKGTIFFVFFLVLSVVFAIFLSSFVVKMGDGKL